jgi:hypothetical protein
VPSIAPAIDGASPMKQPETQDHAAERAQGTIERCGHSLPPAKAAQPCQMSSDLESFFHV